MNKEYLILPTIGIFTRESIYKFKTVDIIQIGDCISDRFSSVLKELSETLEVGEEIDFIVDEENKTIYKKCIIVDKIPASEGTIYTPEKKERIRFTYDIKIKSDWESYIRDHKLSEIGILMAPEELNGYE